MLPPPDPLVEVGYLLVAVALAAASIGILRRRAQRSWGETLVGWGLAATTVVLILGVLFPPVARIQDMGRIVAHNRLRQIAIALHNYSDDHDRRLPPAVLSSRDSQQLLSWRVLILPYLEQDDLFRAFRLDEPWDSPHNLTLLSRMPEVYAAPVRADEPPEPFTTFVQAFVGPGAAFEGVEGLRLPDDFPDGTANTLLLAEAAEAVPWTRPLDLSYTADGPLPRLGGVFKSRGRFREYGPNRLKGFHVVLVDGEVLFKKAGVSEVTLRALITRAGGEQLGSDW
jgi:hypothetical protein